MIAAFSVVRHADPNSAGNPAPTALAEAAGALRVRDLVLKNALMWGSCVLMVFALCATLGAL